MLMVMLSVRGGAGKACIVLGGSGACFLAFSGYTPICRHGNKVETRFVTSLCTVLNLLYCSYCTEYQSTCSSFKKFMVFSSCGSYFISSVIPA